MEPHVSPLCCWSGSGFFIVTPTVFYQLCPEELESRQLLYKSFFFQKKKNIPSSSVLLIEHLYVFSIQLLLHFLLLVSSPNKYGCGCPYTSPELQS